MIFTGIFALFFIIVLKKNNSLNHLFLKFFIIALFLPNFDYAINMIAIFMNLEFNSSVFHSFFAITLISAIFYTYAEYKKDSQYKLISKAFFLGLSAHLAISLALTLDPINYFWPIPDKDLEFSLMHNILGIHLQSTDKIILPLSLLELYFLILYGKFLILKLLKNKSPALDIQRIQRLLKLEKNLFIIFLIIFFVIYFMNILPISLFLTTFSIYYSFILLFNIYVTYKTNFRLI